MYLTHVSCKTQTKCTRHCVACFKLPEVTYASTTDAVQNVVKQAGEIALGVGGQQDNVSAFEEQY